MNKDTQQTGRDNNKSNLRGIIEKYVHNCGDFMDSNAGAFAVLEDIYDIFMNARGIPCDKATELLLPMFLGRAHAAYTNAVLLVLSGASPECFMVIRGCLENAVYALHLQRNPDSQRVWLERKRNNNARKACRNLFTYGNTHKTLALEDTTLKDAVDALYQKCLDCGAHPNVDGHLGTSVVTPWGCNVSMCHPGSELWKRALYATTNGGILALRVFGLIYGSRFDNAGVTRTLDEGPRPMS